MPVPFARLNHLVLAGFALASVVGSVTCAVNDGSQFGDDDDDDGSSSGTGGEGGMILTTSSGQQGGGIPLCTTPDCVGNTPQGNCDGALPIDSADGMDGARAMGLCQVATGESWGVVSADYVRSDGQLMTQPALAIGRGLLHAFGANVQPREGAQMLVLSSGAARQPSDPGYMSVGGHWKDPSSHMAPPGFPKESPSCPGVTTGEPYDSAGLKLTIKTPLDAKSFTFNLDFYTYEFPGYICSTFNDFFVALMNPVPMGVDPDGNISFDAQNNLISVNAGFLEVCNPQMAGGKNFACALGPGELIGTGYDEQIGGSAATSWLQTTAPIENPGQNIELMFAIWDSGDGILDSTILIDNFRFELEEGAVGTIPVPK